MGFALAVTRQRPKLELRETRPVFGSILGARA
jgi:hypothetical protein